MFVLLRDGTFVDYHARDPRLLFVPPGAFLGRTVRDVMPPAIADMMMNALDRACRSDDQIVVEYELPLDEQRFFEARFVRADADRLLAIVRNITEAKRASDLIHDLAGRLIARQETERRRIARDLHDDINQRLAILNLEIDRITAQADQQSWQTRLGKLSKDVAEIAGAVHDLSYALHPARLQVMGLIPAVRSLCDDVSKLHNLGVAFIPGVMPPSIDANVSLCVYRIVQEALHNIARHSGAREAEVRVACDEAHITLQVVDSGVGFDPKRLSHGKLGVLSMKERVAFLNGQLVIDSVPGRGTRISVRIPLMSEGGYAPAPLVAST
jgi:signal transduction histidine kinase